MCLLIKKIVIHNIVEYFINIRLQYIQSLAQWKLQVHTCILEHEAEYSFNIKPSFQIWDSHVKDKTVAIPFYFWYGIPIPVRWHFYIETSPGDRSYKPQYILQWFGLMVAEKWLKIAKIGDHLPFFCKLITQCTSNLACILCRNHCCINPTEHIS